MTGIILHLGPTIYGYDGHGSVRQLTNAAGRVAQVISGDPDKRRVPHTFASFANVWVQRASSHSGFANKIPPPMLGVIVPCG